MSIDIGASLPDLPTSSEGAGTFSDGQNRIVSTRLSLKEFLAREDTHMAALVKLYLEHCIDGNAPKADALPPEIIYKTGMISRTHCLRLSDSADSARYAVWAQDANFDGHRSLQNMVLDDGAPFPILSKIIQAQLSAVLEQGQPAFFEVKGVINDRYYYFTKAILPLSSEQGQIVKCLVPFTDKLPDIPAELREEFCARAVE